MAAQRSLLSSSSTSAPTASSDEGVGAEGPLRRSSGDGSRPASSSAAEAAFSALLRLAGIRARRSGETTDGALGSGGGMAARSAASFSSPSPSTASLFFGEEASLSSLQASASLSTPSSSLARCTSRAHGEEAATAAAAATFSTALATTSHALSIMDARRMWVSSSTRTELRRAPSSLSTFRKFPSIVPGASMDTDKTSLLPSTRFGTPTSTTASNVRGRRTASSSALASALS
mmetsp:Transcript_6820/g.12208  ORF Transcript_6820/g.12208 Transcript_6820/m.12208 type:complete len:233 (-) Transcript_6820:59-757(-)